MRIVESYSHLYGQEYLLLHRPALMQEVQSAIERVDRHACVDPLFASCGHAQQRFSRIDMNAEFTKQFEKLDWHEHSKAFWVTEDMELTRTVARMPVTIQHRAIQLQGAEPISRDLGFDYFKERVGVHLQLDDSSKVSHDIHITQTHFYIAGEIDVGVEILPMKELEMRMTSSVPYYERDVLNIIRQGKGVPSVPLVLIGIAP